MKNLATAVGNKIDRAEKNVSKSVMEELLPSQSDMPCCEISAKESIGIEEVSLYGILFKIKLAHSWLKPSSRITFDLLIMPNTS